MSISVHDLLWLHNLGMSDEQIAKQLYTPNQAQDDDDLLDDPEPTPAPDPAPAPAPAPASDPAPGPAPAPAPDQTQAALMEIIKSLQAQNAMLASGKTPEAQVNVEDALLSLL